MQVSATGRNKIHTVTLWPVWVQCNTHIMLRIQLDHGTNATHILHRGKFFISFSQSIRFLRVCYILMDVKVPHPYIPGSSGCVIIFRDKMSVLIVNEIKLFPAAENAANAGGTGSKG